MLKWSCTWSHRQLYTKCSTVKDNLLVEKMENTPYCFYFSTYYHDVGVIIKGIPRSILIICLFYNILRPIPSQLCFYNSCISPGCVKVCYMLTVTKYVVLRQVPNQCDMMSSKQLFTSQILVQSVQYALTFSWQWLGYTTISFGEASSVCEINVECRVCHVSFSVQICTFLDHITKHPLSTWSSYYNNNNYYYY